jgi:hypothetical protein
MILPRLQLFGQPGHHYQDFLQTFSLQEAWIDAKPVATEPASLGESF